MFHLKDRSIQLVKEQNPTKYVSLTVKGLGKKGYHGKANKGKAGTAVQLC